MFLQKRHTFHAIDFQLVLFGLGEDDSNLHLVAKSLIACLFPLDSFLFLQQ